MVPAGVVVFCLSLFVVSLHGLTCRPCHDVDCPDPSTYNCSLGVLERGCGCCYECAKGHGDDCGGSFNIHGQCAEGLVCYKVSDDGITFWRGVCLTPEEAESYRTSTYAPGGTTPPTRPPWWS